MLDLWRREFLQVGLTALVGGVASFDINTKSGRRGRTLTTLPMQCDFRYTSDRSLHFKQNARRGKMKTVANKVIRLVVGLREGQRCRNKPCCQPSANDTSTGNR